MSRHRLWEIDSRYSDWHYTLHPSLTACDVDMVEYCSACGVPLALFELASTGTGPKLQMRPVHYLARCAGVPTYIVRHRFPAGTPRRLDAAPDAAPPVELLVVRYEPGGPKLVRRFNAKAYESFLLGLRRNHNCEARCKR